LTFGTTRVVGRQPYAPAAFTPGEIHGTHFQRLSRNQGTWFCRREPRKKSPVTPPGIDRLEDIVLRNAADLLQIRSWKAAARIKESWRKAIGEAMVRKLAEAP